MTYQATQNNENLTAPTPHMGDAPLEKDFSRNGKSAGFDMTIQS
jgi:hypothetical protein